MFYLERTIFDSTPNVSLWMSLVLVYSVSFLVGLMMSFVLQDGLPFVIGVCVTAFGLVHGLLAIAIDIIQAKDKP